MAGRRFALALALPLLLFLVAAARRRPEERAGPAGGEPSLRVLLTAPTGGVRIRVAGPYRLLDARTGRVLETGVDLDRELDTASRSVASPLRLVAKDGLFAVGERRYPGDLFIEPVGRRLSLVDEVPLERYLPGVLEGELGASYPPAALRAQAVASRSFAVYAERHAAEKAIYDVTDGTAFQVYRGATGPGDASLRAAVADTRGVVLTYEGRVIPAYFHSTCGGHTAPATEVFGGSLIPPLCGVPCPYCKGSRYYRWSVRFSPGPAATRLGLPAPVSGARVLERGPFGRALTIAFTAGRRVVLPAAEVRRRLGTKNLPSTFLFSFGMKDGALTARGGGFGHGVGMCQEGAVEMAREHASAGDILAQYYPTAELTRIY